MIGDHLERAAIEIHFALADLSIPPMASSPASIPDEDRALLAALRFALFELEWVRRRLGEEARAALPDAVPPYGVSPENPC